MALSDVSIHAPPKGRDKTSDDSGGDNLQAVPGLRFNPRAPEGARRLIPAALLCYKMFQSTRPRRGATSLEQEVIAFAAGFNPRAPEGARLEEMGVPE